jgi:membrane associated rhomboid family serine protease
MIGLAFLAVAMCGAILLITHVLFGPPAAIPITGAAAAVFGTLWYVLPLARSRDSEADF